ncbi:hypothetical protein ACSSS7_002973 [Eimeria intestinalis]
MPVPYHPKRGVHPPRVGLKVLSPACPSMKPRRQHVLGLMFCPCCWLSWSSRKRKNYRSNKASEVRRVGGLLLLPLLLLLLLHRGGKALFFLLLRRMEQPALRQHQQHQQQQQEQRQQQEQQQQQQQQQHQGGVLCRKNSSI